MSRLAQARPAVRPALKARALLSGPPGSGKTRTALIVATTLAEGGPILVIDTEKESALTYADDFTFDHLRWAPPYNPRDLAGTLIDAGQQYAVVIVDSLSHFWRGEGGTLEIADGKFTGWKDARPAQNDLVEGMLGCQAHLIGCARSKVEHVQEKDERGRHVVRKLGMAIVQSDDMEYELNIAAEIAMDHSMTISKSRTVAVPVGRTFHAGHAEDFAALYRDWLKGGEPPAPAEVVADLVARMNALPEQARKAAKQEFVAVLGRPDHLRESQAADAEALVARHEDVGTTEPPAQTADLPSDPPAAGGEPAPDDQLIDKDTVILLSKCADRAWPLDDFGRGKTAERRRYRYALTAMITGGRTVHLDALTVGEARQLEHDLAALTEGVWTSAATDDALVIVDGDGDEVVCPWVQAPTEVVA